MVQAQQSRTYQLRQGHKPGTAEGEGEGGGRVSYSVYATAQFLVSSHVATKLVSCEDVVGCMILYDKLGWLKNPV